MPSLLAPAWTPTLTPAAPGKCSFDNYRAFGINPKQLEISATLQSLADNAEVQILRMTEQRDGPSLASVIGADALVNKLQTLCRMQCVADRGDSYSPSPAATFHSNNDSRNLKVIFYGDVSGSTFGCITKNTDLIRET